VIEKLTHRDWRVASVTWHWSELWHVAGDRGVELKHAAINQLHNGRCRGDLGHREPGIDRLRRRWLTSAEIGKANARTPAKTIAVNQANGEARHLLAEAAIERCC
jgi:hypothetical protein